MKPGMQPPAISWLSSAAAIRDRAVGICLGKCSASNRRVASRTSASALLPAALTSILSLKERRTRQRLVRVKGSDHWRASTIRTQQKNLANLSSFPLYKTGSRQWREAEPRSHSLRRCRDSVRRNSISAVPDAPSRPLLPKVFIKRVIHRKFLSQALLIANPLWSFRSLSFSESV